MATADLDLLSFRALNHNGFIKLEAKFKLDFNTATGTSLGFAIYRNDAEIRKISITQMKESDIYTLIYHDHNGAFIASGNISYQLRINTNTSYSLSITNSAGVEMETVGNQSATFTIHHYCTHEHLVLSTADRILNLKYNPSLTNCSIINSEAFVQTLGSKFPFYRRNAILNYKQFSIGGLLSYHLEDEADELEYYIKDNKNKGLFLTRNQKQLNNELLDYYDQEIHKEKLFRDKVMEEFLFENSNKLLYSATESPVIVQLSKISLTPQQQLGRLIYSFTAQATEVEEATQSAIQKYIATDSKLHILLLNSQGDRMGYDNE